MAKEKTQRSAKVSFDDALEPQSAMGRTRLPFDEGLFKRLCYIQCSKVEIASVMELSVDTLERRIKEIFDMTWKEAKSYFSGKGRAKLREIQFKQAETSTPMAIWLGRQYLGQGDKSEEEFTPCVQKAFDPTKMSKQEYMDAVKSTLIDVVVTNKKTEEPQT
jgi:hypothetical protein